MCVHRVTVEVLVNVLKNAPYPLRNTMSRKPRRTKRKLVFFFSSKK